MTAQSFPLQRVYLTASRHPDVVAEAEFVRYRREGGKMAGPLRKREYSLNERNYNRIVAAGGAINLEDTGYFEVCITPKKRVSELRRRLT